MDMSDFKNIFDKAPIGIFHSTVEGKLLGVNSEYSKIYDYDSTEEIMNEVKDGSILPTEVMKTLLINDEGKVNEILSVSRNITERK
jgi:PAS domain-containing protein